MDDDIEVDPGAVAVMLDDRQLSDFIHVRKSSAAGPFVLEALRDLAGPRPVRYREDLSFKNGKAWTVLPFGSFEGPSSTGVLSRRFGYPGERFFILGDATLYGFLDLAAHECDLHQPFRHSPLPTSAPYPGPPGLLLHGPELVFDI